jgi:hypothetical protein
MNSDFASFWEWLIQEPRDILRLGEQLKADGDNPIDEEFEEEDPPRMQDDEVIPSADRPAPGFVRIGPGSSGGGLITTGKGNLLPFNRDVAEATWHRYHGMRQAAYRFQATNGLVLPEKMPHRMASSFVRPNDLNHPLPQSWIDCPNPTRAPAYIAAAIRYYCRSFPYPGFCPPDATLA